MYSFNFSYYRVGLIHSDPMAHFAHPYTLSNLYRMASLDTLKDSLLPCGSQYIFHFHILTLITFGFGKDFPMTDSLRVAIELQLHSK